MDKIYGITPHGGKLVNLKDLSEKTAVTAEKLPKLTINNWNISDLELLAIGGFSPLTGFMSEAEYKSVVKTMHLPSGVVWSIPITLPVSEERALLIDVGEKIALVDADGTVYGTMTVTDKFKPDKLLEAAKVYGTTEAAHPGVKKM